MGGAGRVVGNLIRAGTSRLRGAARDNGPVCSLATGEPATVSTPILRSQGVSTGHFRNGARMITLGEYSIS
jgi:hypothetical protein